MRDAVDQPKLKFVPGTDFFRSVGVSFELGSKLVTLGILHGDATLNDPVIFLADIATAQKAKAAVALYRAHRARAINNVKELSHA